MNWDRISESIEKAVGAKLALAVIERQEFVLKIIKKYFSIEQRREITPDILDRTVNLLIEEGEDWYDNEGQFQLEVSARIFLEALLQIKLANKK